MESLGQDAASLLGKPKAEHFARGELRTTTHLEPAEQCIGKPSGLDQVFPKAVLRTQASGLRPPCSTALFPGRAKR